MERKFKTVKEILYKMNQIILNSTEQDICRILAKARYDNARERGRVDLKIGKQSNVETDLEGIGGEVAFCKAFNLFPPLMVGEFDKDDCVLHSGTKVDIKTTKYRTGHLLANNTKKVGDVDIYALVVGEFPVYSIGGYATSKQLISEEAMEYHRNCSLFNGVGYALPQKDLLRFPDSFYSYGV